MTLRLRKVRASHRWGIEMKLRAAKILMTGVSPLFLLLTMGPVLAQSTATQAVESSVESVTVTGEKQITGIMKPITVPKERSTIT